MTQQLIPGFVVVHSHRLEDLTAVATQFMARYPLAPLQAETVLVQSNGIAQWLKINLAQLNGIAAMLNVSLPARFVWQAYRAVLGDDIPKTSPFDKDRLAWRIMRLLPGLVAGGQNADFTALANYLHDSNLQYGNADTPAVDQRKLFQLSLRIADLFDQYQNYRADWLDNWSHGRDWLDNPALPLPAGDLWQAQLWRALVQDIGVAALWANRAGLHRRFVDTAKALTQRPAGMPARVVVFGISSLPQQSLEVLDAIKGFTQVVLCVHNPCKHYWANIVDGKEALKNVLKTLQRDQRRHDLKTDMAEEVADDELHQYAHPLLASWGKQGRDYIHLLDLYDETLQKQQAFNAIKFELFDETEPGNLLQQLQNDILNLRPLHETQSQWPAVAADDTSLQFQRCHSVQREVEVLHDQLLAAFASDPHLTPRDIMVMVPDVNSYAPHVDAVFGRIERGSSRYIPYTLADQGERHQQPLMIALEMLLSIGQLRITQTEVLCLLAIPAVQRRFALAADDVASLQHWCNDAGARWGLDNTQRAGFGMPANEPTNSWWFALERMILGYAMGAPNDDAQPRWQHIEPYHEVAGLSADAAGKLANFISALNHWWRHSADPVSLTGWAERAEKLLQTFFATDTNDPGPDASQEKERLLLTKLQSELQALQDVAGDAAFDQPMDLAIFKESWLSRIDQPNLNQRFMAGAVNVATLMPMRAIPFKHIYVLGMNDDAYPRRQPAVDFDLMAGHYRPGDRSRRDDDRYLFLEALLSARQRFSISWLGRSVQDNSERPPSVLVAQLQEHIQQGWRSATASDVLTALTTDHKLQVYSRDYLSGTNPKLFTYASEWLAAQTTAAAQNAAATGSGVAAVLSPWAPDIAGRWQLNGRDAERFLREPAQLFFNQRLNTWLTAQSSEAQDRESFELDGLAMWQICQSLLTQGVSLLRTVPCAKEPAAKEPVAEQLTPALQRQLERLAREGKLGVEPLRSQLSQQLLNRVLPVLQAVAEAINTEPPLQPAPDQLLSWQNGQLLLQDVARQLFYSESQGLLQLLVSASKAQPKYYLLAYVMHLLLTVQPRGQQQGQVSTRLFFRAEKADAQGIEKVPDVSFGPLPVAVANSLLATLSDAMLANMSAPGAIVGELALGWLEHYVVAVSGSKPTKAGKQSTAPLAEAEARISANEKLLAQWLKDHNGDFSAWPYANRLLAEQDGAANPDAAAQLEQLLASEPFQQAVLALYAPIIRLKYGQPVCCELPEPRYTDAEQGAEA